MTPYERLRKARDSVNRSREDLAATVRTAADVVMTAEDALAKFRDLLVARRLDRETIVNVLDTLADILDEARRQAVH